MDVYICTVIRIGSIMMLSLILLVQAPVQQLLKVYALVEHYYEHKERNGSMDIVEFLTMHYAKGDVKDADHDRDMQLPFKHPSSTSLIFTFFESRAITVEPVYMPLVSGSTSLYRCPFCLSQLLSAIWHPPKAGVLFS